jgi:5'-3' exoribonuclease 2
MTSADSPIIDFYPETFEIDMNGKRMAWQGVALLPFIDQKRLLDAMAPRYGNLTVDETQRNKWGNDVLFAGEENPLYPAMEALYGKRKSDEVSSSIAFGICLVFNYIVAYCNRRHRKSWHERQYAPES